MKTVVTKRLFIKHINLFALTQFIKIRKEKKIIVFYEFVFLLQPFDKPFINNNYSTVLFYSPK